MSKYLMIDLDDVLFGDFIEKIENITDSDLILHKYNPPIWDGYRVLRQGLAIVAHLNELVDKYGYTVVFLSRADADFQIKNYRLLQEACRQKGITFPEIPILGVIERNPSLPYRIPHIEMKDNIKIGSVNRWDDQQGLLEVLLEIKGADRANHVVFTQSPNALKMSLQRQYRTFHIEKGFSTLDGALKNILDENHAKDVVTQTISFDTLTPNQRFYAQAFQTLLLDTPIFRDFPGKLRAFLETKTLQQREAMQRQSLSDFWSLLRIDEQEELLQFFGEAEAPTPYPIHRDPSILNNILQGRLDTRLPDFKDYLTVARAYRNVVLEGKFTQESQRYEKMLMGEIPLNVTGLDQTKLEAFWADTLPEARIRAFQSYENAKLKMSISQICSLVPTQLASPNTNRPLHGASASNLFNEYSNLDKKFLAYLSENTEEIRIAIGVNSLPEFWCEMLTQEEKAHYLAEFKRYCETQQSNMSAGPV